MKQFNTWERYFDPNHPKHVYQVDRHHWLMDRISDGKLLDVGCSGGLALYLAGKNENVTALYGVDTCEDTNEKARERLSKYKNKEVVILNSTADSLPFEGNCFDTVLCGETLEHVPDDKRAIDEIARVAKHGASILITVPKDGHLSKEHIRLYDIEKLNRLIMSAGIDIIESDEMKASKNGYYLLRRGIKQ